MSKIRLWLHTAAGTVSVILFTLSIVLLIIAASPWGSSFLTIDQAAFINNVLIGLATNFLGIIVTVSFVQHFLDRQEVELERSEEIKTIRRYDRYMKTLIRRYGMFFIAITTRLKDRNKMDHEHPLDHDFTISDLADMYKSSPYVSEGFSEPTAELFYKAEGELKAYMLRMLENIDFKYNPDLEELLLTFVEKSTDLDMRGQILESCMKVKMGIRKDQVEMIEKMIADESQDYLKMLDEGKLHSNLMLPYALLFVLLQDQRRILKEYRDYVDDIENRARCA